MPIFRAPIKEIAAISVLPFMTNCMNTQDSAPRLLYDRKEAARQLSISVRSLDYMIAAKKFDTRRIGKKVLITHASLIRFSQANHYEGVDSAA